MTNEQGLARVDQGSIVEAMVGNQWHIVAPGTYVEGQGCTQFVERGTGLLVTIDGSAQAVRSEIRNESETDREPRRGGERKPR